MTKEHDEILFADDDDDELLFADDEEQSDDIPSQSPWKILLVDDEQEIHQVTTLSLQSFRFAERGIEFLHAYSGAQAREILTAHDDIALVLLDVVMEQDDAGLQVVEYIRQQLDNHFIRVLLRTGQPGVAPEKQTIETYDIDGYLPKAELTSHRLYVAVRTGLKAYRELLELERHREILTAIHAYAVSLHSFDPLDTSLWNLLQTAVAIAPTPFAILELNSYDEQEDWKHSLLYLSSHMNDQTSLHAQQRAQHIRQTPSLRQADRAVQLEDGYLLTLKLHHELGYGWIYLQHVQPDPLTQQALLMLAAHANNGLYSNVAQAMLSAREKPLFDAISI